MSNKPAMKWFKLDNAAKIFPPTVTRRDTKVFRFYCRLNEAVDEQLLQSALDFTFSRFPLYRTILKKGIFWYYLEESALQPVVHIENKQPCAPLFSPNRKNLLFDVSYFGSRINLEVYHALCDATGAMQFLKQLVARYLKIRYPEQLHNAPSIDYDASAKQKQDDSFYKYYDKQMPRLHQKQVAAYRLHGDRNAAGHLNVIEGSMSVTKLLELAHGYNATLSAFLSALMIKSIGDGLAVRDKSKPVVLTVPVNLRSFFSSETARNFFSIVNVGYSFKNDSDSLESIITHISEDLKRQLTEEHMSAQLNLLSSYENSLTARIAPVIIKNPGLKIANILAERNITAAFSNIGKVVMPDEYNEYISRFGVLCSTNRIQACMCTFGDTFVISFTTQFIDTDIQRRFFRSLASMGINIEICSNTGRDMNA